MAANKKTDVTENYPWLVYSQDIDATENSGGGGGTRTLTIVLATTVDDKTVVPNNEVTEVAYYDGEGNTVKADFTKTTYEMGGLTFPAATTNLPVGTVFGITVKTGGDSFATSFGGLADVGVVGTTEDGFVTVPSAEYGEIACLFMVES